MIGRLLRHAKGNAVAYVALFVALGGTSYAAVSLPRNSVGTRQLRNGAVTPAKLRPGSFGGHILFSAHVSADGQVISSDPAGATTIAWNDDPTRIPDGGFVTWHRSIPSDCFPLGDAVGQPLDGTGRPPWAGVSIITGSAKVAKVAAGTPDPSDVYVVVVCPG